MLNTYPNGDSVVDYRQQPQGLQLLHTPYFGHGRSVGTGGGTGAGGGSGPDTVGAIGTGEEAGSQILQLGNGAGTAGGTTGTCAGGVGVNAITGTGTGAGAGA